MYVTTFLNGIFPSKFFLMGQNYILDLQLENLKSLKFKQNKFQVCDLVQKSPKETS